MSTFYASLAATAKRLIDSKGQSVVLDRTIDGLADPVTGVVTGGAQYDKATKGILLDYNSDEIDGTLILRTDKKLVIDASIRPMKSDRPKLGGEYVGAIVNIKEVSPAGVPIVYFLQVRA